MTAQSATDQNKLAISFEFFPPKTDKAEESLWQTIERLAPLAPRFVSVTYGAGGTTRERTPCHSHPHSPGNDPGASGTSDLRRSQPG